MPDIRAGTERLARHLLDRVPRESYSLAKTAILPKALSSEFTDSIFPASPAADRLPGPDYAGDGVNYDGATADRHFPELDAAPRHRHGRVPRIGAGRSGSSGDTADGDGL